MVVGVEGVDRMILNAILFSIILLLCIISYVSGFYVGCNNNKPKTELKKEPEPLTEEQERAIEKRQREINNFNSYDGSSQE